MKEIVSIGEILVDFAPVPLRMDGPPSYQGNPGGSTANLACVMAVLGHDTGLIGKVGDDAFGRLCINAAAACGVDTSRIVISTSHPTTLAFVTLDESGNRSFSFYRTGTADGSLSVADIERVGVPASRFLHFGGISLAALPERDAAVYAVRQAKARGSMISYDPNLRMALWESPEEAKAVTLDMMRLADIVKISEEEGSFLFGETDPTRLCAILEERYSPAMTLVTLAQNGCVASIGGRRYRSHAYNVATVDTTGAGDSFLGGILHGLLALGKQPGELSAEQVQHILDFANATGSLVTAKKGAIPAIPTLAEIETCMAQTPKLAPKEGA